MTIVREQATGRRWGLYRIDIETGFAELVGLGISFVISVESLLDKFEVAVP